MCDYPARVWGLPSLKSEPLTKALNKLWYVVWEIRRGLEVRFEFEGKCEPFEFTLGWGCYRNIFSLQAVTGHINYTPYKIFFGLDEFELVSEELGAWYKFNDHKNTVIHNNITICEPACYCLKEDYVGDPNLFIERPLNSNSKKSPMTPKKEREAAKFIIRLCETVEKFEKVY